MIHTTDDSSSGKKYKVCNDVGAIKFISCKNIAIKGIH